MTGGPGEERLRQADINYADSWRIILSGSASGDAREFGGLMAGSCGFRARVFNVAIVMRPLDDPEATLSALQTCYEERELPYRIFIREGLDPAFEDAVRARGFLHEYTIPGMLLHPIPGIPEPPGELEIERVEDDAGIADFGAVAGPSFGIPKELIGGFINGNFARHPAVTLFLGRIEGVPVTTSALVRSGSVAGIYWVTTDPEYRRRGLGEALTWRAVAEGAGSGCDLANLQASEIGAPIYQRMGFRTLAPYRRYESPRPPA